MNKIVISIFTNTSHSEQSEDGLENGSVWFHKGVVKLLEIASDKAEARTLKALEMDEVI